MDAMSNTTKIIIPGRPVPKKNNPRPFKRGKRLVILPSDAFERYEIQALWHLKEYRVTYDTLVIVECLYWPPNRQWWPDLVGLLQGTSDILEKAGILKNDKFIHNYGNSHIAGLDRQNPRAEITIKEYVGVCKWYR